MTPEQGAALRTVIGLLSRMLGHGPVESNHEGGAAADCYGCVQDMVEATGREVCPKTVPGPVHPDAKHRGGNAEDCPACERYVHNISYPFLCPGP